MSPRDKGGAPKRKKRSQDSTMPTRAEVERLSPTPTPKQHLAAVKSALRKALKAGAPPDVRERYEAEVRRVQRWVDQGAPMLPLYATVFDPVTDQTWAYARAQGYMPVDPDLTTDATVSLEWPGGIVLQTLVGRLVAVLIPPTGKEQLEHALNILVQQPPLRIDVTDWGYERAKLFVTLCGLQEAIANARDEWTGRIGSLKGSGKVTGVPAAGVIGYAKWLQQEAPHYARKWLLDYAGIVSRPEQEIEGSEKTAWDMDAQEHPDALDAIEHKVFGTPEPGDPEVLLLTKVLIVANARERLVLFAMMRSEHAAAVATARVPLSDFEREVLATECESRHEIARVTGIPYDQVAMISQRLREKIAKLAKKVPIGR